MTVRDAVLLADDDVLSREFMAEVLTGAGLDVTVASDGTAALAALAQRRFEFVFTDLRMPGADGLAVMAAAKRVDADRPVVLVTAHGTMHVAVEALRSGADDILEKPVSPSDLQLVLHRLRDRGRLLAENRRLRAESGGDDLLVVSPAMTAVADLVRRVAASSATVLISGESGTGKECVAALLHRSSDRRRAAFVKINCAAVPDALIESEFFGHEAGAFTGASARRPGRFELADSGTLFLDEIGEMPLPMQAKLLRVLQDGEVTRVGGNAPVQVDVRVVAASNRDLRAAVRGGTFREDLFYRLNVVPVLVPPLRERRDDVVPLARHFLRPRVQLTAAAERLLTAHDWPGNVRELQNVIQRACLLCRAGVIDADLLAPWIDPGLLLPQSRPATGNGAVHGLVGRPLRNVEADLIHATLAHCHGNRTRAAEMLGIGVRTLFNKLRDLAPQR